MYKLTILLALIFLSACGSSEEKRDIPVIRKCEPIHTIMDCEPNGNCWVKFTNGSETVVSRPHIGGVACLNDRGHWEMK